MTFPKSRPEIKIILIPFIIVYIRSLNFRKLFLLLPLAAIRFFGLICTFSFRIFLCIFSEFSLISERPIKLHFRWKTSLLNPNEIAFVSEHLSDCLRLCLLQIKATNLPRFDWRWKDFYNKRSNAKFNVWRT